MPLVAVSAELTLTKSVISKPGFGNFYRLNSSFKYSFIPNSFLRRTRSTIPESLLYNLDLLQVLTNNSKFIFLVTTVVVPYFQ